MDLRPLDKTKGGIWDQTVVTIVQRLPGKSTERSLVVTLLGFTFWAQLQAKHVLSLGDVQERKRVFVLAKPKVLKR